MILGARAPSGAHQRLSTLSHRSERVVCVRDRLVRVFARTVLLLAAVASTWIKLLVRIWFEFAVANCVFFFLGGRNIPVTLLVDILSKKSTTILDKWKKVGQKLGLEDETLFNIERKSKDSRHYYFNVMINRWAAKKGMRKDIPKFQPASLRAFADALKSEEVGEGDLAEMLGDCFKGIAIFIELIRLVNKIDNSSSTVYRD